MPTLRPSGIRLFALLLVSATLAACTPRFASPYLAGAGTPAEARAQAEQLVRMAGSALGSGDAEAAAGMLERAPTLDPDNVPATIAFGDALLRMERPQEASEVYARVFDTAPQDAHHGYARAMLALARPQDAIEHLRLVLAQAPEDARLLSALGVAYDAAGQHDEAQTAYRQGLAVQPADEGLRTNFGLSLALSGQYERAIAALRPLAESAGSSRRARQNLALAYGLKGDVVAAERLSRIDLAETEVRRNMTLFAALRGQGSKVAAAVIGPPAKRMAMVEPVRRAPVAPVRQEPVAAPTPILAASVPAAPIPLAAVALADSELSLGASPVGSWFVDLGRDPDPQSSVRRWLALRAARPNELGALTRLAGAGGGPEPLLAGPLADKGAAGALCAALGKAVPRCVPTPL